MMLVDGLTLHLMEERVDGIKRMTAVGGIGRMDGVRIEEDFPSTQ